MLTRSAGSFETYGNPLSAPVSRQIVGVVADVIDRVGQRENVPQIYVPFCSRPNEHRETRDSRERGSTTFPPLCATRFGQSTKINRLGTSR